MLLLMAWLKTVLAGSVVTEDLNEKLITYMEKWSIMKSNSLSDLNFRIRAAKVDRSRINFSEKL